MLQTQVIEPAAQPRGSVIWLHGLGADGHDFVPVVPELALPETLPLRFIFPHAPIRPVTINGGMPMRSWYDILSMGHSREVNEDQLAESTAEIESLIEAQIRQGIAPERIVLIGFSQGGAVAYNTALRHSRRLAGLAALSTYRIGAGESAYAPHPANAELPIFISHGDWDSVVPVALGKAAYESLLGEGYQPQWHSYPMDHEVCLAQIQRLGRWLCEQFKD